MRLKVGEKFVATTPKPLRDEDTVVRWIEELTGESEGVVRGRLRDEYGEPGVNVRRALEEAGLEPYLWDERLGEFYDRTDAFIYELVIWNMNRLKLQARRWVRGYLERALGEGAEVLVIGDGLGFDSVYLAAAGNKVTYYEVAGLSESFARRVFEENGEEITVLNAEDEIRLGRYDAVVCLDVLEHVPDPRGFVKRVSEYLRGGGVLVTHAPFYMIHPSGVTHLKANRLYSGMLSLYRDNDLRLIGGKWTWNPIVLQKGRNGQGRFSCLKFDMLKLRVAGLYLMLGRFSSFPFLWVNKHRRKKRKWFEP